MAPARGTSDSARVLFLLLCPFNGHCPREHVRGTLCFSGYTGPTCTECMDGLVLTTSLTCSACPPLGATIATVLALFALFAAFLWRKQKKAQKGEPPSILSVYSKILLSSLQQNATALSFGFEWSGFMTSFFAAQADITSIGSSRVSLGVACVFLSFLSLLGLGSALVLVYVLI